MEIQASNNQAFLEDADMQSVLDARPSATGLSCPDCGKRDGQWRGFRIQKQGIVHRRCCNECGRWFIGGSQSWQTQASIGEESASPACLRAGYDFWIEADVHSAETTVTQPYLRLSRIRGNEIREIIQ